MTLSDYLAHPHMLDLDDNDEVYINCDHLVCPSCPFHIDPNCQARQSNLRPFQADLLAYLHTHKPEIFL